MEFNKKELAQLRKLFMEYRQDYINDNKEGNEAEWERANLIPLEKSFKRFVASIKDYIERRVLMFSDDLAHSFYKHYEEYVFLK